MSKISQEGKNNPNAGQLMIGKQNVLYPGNTTLTTKSNEAPTHATTWMAPGTSMRGETPDARDHVLCGLFFMKRPEEAALQRQKIDAWLLKAGGNVGTKG